MRTRNHMALAAALIAALLLGGTAAGAASAPAPDGQPSPDSPEFPAWVLGKVDDMYRGKSSQGRMEMYVKTRHWERTMEMDAWSLGTDYSLVRIRAPKKDRGTATLKAKNELFTYLGKTGRTVKITSGMMGGSWMGSHFTNDDIVRETRLSEDFDTKLVFRGADPDPGGAEVYRFELIPKPDTPVSWGKIEVTVRQSDLQPVSERFFDEDGHAVRLLQFAGHEEISGRVIPTVMTMTPLDKPGEVTRMTWSDLSFDVGLKPSFFTLQRLERGR